MKPLFSHGRLYIENCYRRISYAGQAVRLIMKSQQIK